MNSSQKSYKLQAASYKLELKWSNCLSLRELEGSHSRLKEMILQAEISFSNWTGGKF